MVEYTKGRGKCKEVAEAQPLNRWLTLAAPNSTLHSIAVGSADPKFSLPHWGIPDNLLVLHQGNMAIQDY